MTKYRILGIFLCAMLCVGFLPAKAFAQENSQEVGTKEEFISALEDASITTIHITASMDLTGTGVQEVSGRTIDLGGNTIYADNFTLIFQGTDFTIKNGTFDAKGGSYALFVGDSGTTDNVLIEGVTMNGGINIYNATNVILRDVDITGMQYYAIWCDEHGQATVESGNFKTNGVAVLGLTPSDTDSSLQIKGGNFVTNGKPLVLEADDKAWGDPVISGGKFDVQVDAAYCAPGYSLVQNEDGSYGVCGHTNTEVRNRVEATCTETGYTGDTYCKDCGKLLSGGTEIPAAGHTLSEHAAWMGDDVSHWHVCASCGVKLDEGAHISDNGVVTVQASETEAGVKTYSCTICGQVLKTEAIPMTGNADLGTAPTEPNETETPKTGESTDMTWYRLLMVIFGSAAAAMGVAMRIENKKQRQK